MDVLERFAELDAKLKSTNGRLEKEAYLREVEGDAEVLEVLRFLFNPFIVTGISDKKLNKFKNFTELPLLAAFEGPSKADASFLDVLEYFKKNNTGRDEDVRYLANFANKTSNAELVFSIVKKDLKLGIQNTTLNKVYGNDFVPKFDVMLAEPYADFISHVEGKDFIITEKLDGVRGVLSFNPSPSFLSRSGKPYLEMADLEEQAEARRVKARITATQPRRRPLRFRICVTLPFSCWCVGMTEYSASGGS